MFWTIEWYVKMFMILWLQATKNALNIVKDDLIAKVDELTG